MTNRPAFLHPVAFVLLHVVAVLSAYFIGYAMDSLVVMFLAPVLALLAPVIPMIRAKAGERRKVYMVSMGIASLFLLPIFAWWGFLFHAYSGKIG